MGKHVSVFTFVAVVILCGPALRAQSDRALAAGDNYFSIPSAKWSEPYKGSEGYPKGARRASLNVDPKSGGETYYAHFPAGSRFAPHWHAHPEYAVVLRGKAVHRLGTERRTMIAGDYVIIPPKTAHAWEADAGGDVYILIRRDGPADFNFVKEKGEPASKHPESAVYPRGRSIGGPLEKARQTGGENADAENL